LPRDSCKEDPPIYVLFWKERGIDRMSGKGNRRRSTISLGWGRSRGELTTSAPASGTGRRMNATARKRKDHAILPSYRQKTMRRRGEGYKMRGDSWRSDHGT